MNYFTNFTGFEASIALFNYLLGSIPFGLVLTRLAGTVDLRKVGSGNIGATNVFRTGQKGLAFLTLFLDALKGFLAVYVSSYWGEWAAYLAAVFVLMGHLFPVWLLFKGGKGVATYYGILIAFSPQLALFFAFIWLTVLGISRYSSLAALSATFFAPLAFWLFDKTSTAVVFSLLTLLVYIRHSGNIRRLLAGEEPKILKKAL